MNHQEFKVEVNVKFSHGEYHIDACRAEALTQVTSHTAVIAYGVRDIARQAINEYLKQNTPVYLNGERA